MPKLMYDPLEDGWECSVCGARYTSDEVARVFGYQAYGIDIQRSYVGKPIPVVCHCMDCGETWEELGEKFL